MRLRTRLKNAVVLVLAAVFVPFLWMGLFAGPDLALEEAYEKRLAELRDRVQYAESLNRERENDVHHLRQQMGMLLSAHSSANKTDDGNLTIDADTRALLSNLSFGSSDIQPPSMFNHLPHLIGKPQGLRPAYKMSRGRFGVSIVLGIPTIKRERDSYLLQTLDSLLSGLNAEERPDCLIVVFVGEPNDVEYVQQVAEEVKEKFPDAVAEGVVEVISPSPSFYPNMNTLKESFGDTLQRVKWRTKQILDFSFLMLYCKSRGTYYVQLEDDVVTKAGYLSTMKNFALNQKTEDWVLLEFSYLGFIGKLFKSSDLPRVVEFFLMFHRDKPIDWLLDHFLYVKVCNPEKDAWNCAAQKQYYKLAYRPVLFELQPGVPRPYPEHLEPPILQTHIEDYFNQSNGGDAAALAEEFGMCERLLHNVRIRFRPSLFQHVGTYSSLTGKVQKEKKHCRRSIGELRRRFKPSLFQHIGVHSSLQGKVQKLKDKDFGRSPLHRAHFNPNAQVWSSMRVYQHFSIERAYMGETFFWATIPQADDVVVFSFDPPILIEKYLFKSGNPEHPGDRFYDTVVEVLPVEQPHDLDKYRLAADSSNFIVIGEFDSAIGIAEGSVDAALGQIDTLRIHVLSTSQSWVILNEIFIKELKTKR